MVMPVVALTSRYTDGHMSSGPHLMVHRSSVMSRSAAGAVVGPAAAAVGFAALAAGWARRQLVPR